MEELESLTARLIFMTIMKLEFKRMEKIMILLRKMALEKDKLHKETIMVMENLIIVVVKKVKHFSRYKRRKWQKIPRQGVMVAEGFLDGLYPEKREHCTLTVLAFQTDSQQISRITRSTTSSH